MTTTDRQCPHGHLVGASTVYCTQCGATTSEGLAPLVCAFGHELAPGDAFCPKCGTQPRATGFVSAATLPPPPPGFASAGPDGLGTPAPPRYPPAYMYMQPQSTNGLAIASLVVSLVPICGANAVAALVLGIIALNQIKTTNQAGRGLAIAGIVISAIQLAAGVLYLTVILGLLANTSSSTPGVHLVPLHSLRASLHLLVGGLQR